MKKTTLHSGWLTKSPPEKKIHGAWRIFTPHWRRRFFVLSTIPASTMLPGSCPAQLEYFDSEKLAKRKGNINLNNCEQVVVHLESDYYQHVFIIKTTDRGNNRTYYLAADSEPDMERWVEKLCSVLQLQDEGRSPITPALKHSQSTIVPPRSTPVATPRFMSTPTSPTASSGILSPLSETVFDSPPRQEQPEDYLVLNECHSGPPPATLPRTAGAIRVVTIKERTPASMSSQQSRISEEYYNNTSDFSGNSDDLYNHPRSYGSGSIIYKVPPVLDEFGARRDSDLYKVPARHDTTYDVPPPSGRDSNYDYPPPTSGQKSEDFPDTYYDYPTRPVHGDADSDLLRPLWECSSRKTSDVSSDTYDVLPPKPPVGHHLTNGTGTSMRDVGGNGSLSGSSVYDVPPLGVRNTEPLPPPPRPHLVTPKIHRYINAAPTPVAGNQRLSSQSQNSSDDSVYLSMSGPEMANDVYLAMGQVEMAGGTQRSGSFANNQPRRQASSGHSPQPVHARDALPKTLPRSYGTAMTIAGTGGIATDMTDSLHETKRTRSFKRNISPPSENLILPQKKSGPSDDSSSSESDDDDSSGRHSVQEYFNIQNSETDIPSPPGQSKPVVQYLDLDLNSSPNATPIGTSSQLDSQDRIEYNEIDIEKTQALFDAKLMLEKERKGSEKSES